MASSLPKVLFAGLLLGAAASSANGQLTIDANFTTSDTSDFPGSTPIADQSNAATIETTIDQAIAQITSLVETPLTISIDFVDDPNAGLGESVAPLDDITYTQYLSYLNAETGKSSFDAAALASLPAGPGTGINHNSSEVLMSAALLDAIGDTSDGNSIISENGGFAGTIGLDMSVLNDSRTGYDDSKYDLVSTVTHEVDEILGVGGQGSTLGEGTTTDVGPLDLYRYSASGVRSYSTSSNVSSYFSINGGVTDLVHFNQDSQGDYSDWGDGVKPADGLGNNPPQVQDAFADSDAEPNMGRNEAISLDVAGYDMTAAGLALEAIPEPADCARTAVLGLAVVLAIRRARKT